MKQLSILFLFSLLFAACSDDKKESEPVFVTNIVIADAGKVFSPGEAIILSADGFQEGDQFILDSRWPLQDAGPIKEGQRLDTNPIIKEQTATKVVILAPGHIPASTTKILLRRSGDKLMTLGKVSVADGQSPKEFQLYGITNSRSMSSHPHGIQQIDLAKGTPTDIVKFSDDEDFTMVTNAPGTWTLCGKWKKDGSYSIGSFDLSIHHWGSTGEESPLTFCASGSRIFAITQVNEKNLTIYGLNTSSYSRAMEVPLFPLPDGLKPEALSRYKGVQLSAGRMLLSADNGNGTFSPVTMGGKNAISVFDPIEADALIPFWIATRKVVAEGSGSSYIIACGFALAKPNDGGTELRLWNETTNSLEEPFATFPNRIRSIAPHFSENAQELYVLFDTNRGGGIINIYDLQKKEWRNFPNFDFPYSEIVFAK